VGIALLIGYHLTEGLATLLFGWGGLLGQLSAGQIAYLLQLGLEILLSLSVMLLPDKRVAQGRS